MTKKTTKPQDLQNERQRDKGKCILVDQEGFQQVRHKPRGERRSIFGGNEMQYNRRKEVHEATERSAFTRPANTLTTEADARRSEHVLESKAEVSAIPNLEETSKQGHAPVPRLPLRVGKNRGTAEVGRGSGGPSGAGVEERKEPKGAR